MLVQFLNALIEMVLTVLGIRKTLSLVHPSKAEPPIDSKPSFNVSDVRLVQSSKAELPIDLTETGKVNDVMQRH